MRAQKSVLIVGVGSIGERHVRCFTMTRRVELNICEVSASLRKSISERYPIKTAFENLDNALAERPEIVVICTPAHLHLPIAIQAAKGGAHLLIEKPLSTTLDGVDILRREITTQGLTAAVAYVYRAHPALAAMRDAIVAGRFGEPVQLTAVFGQHFPFYRPAYRETYYREHATGGGAVQDALTHVVNAAEWLVGPTDRVVADLDHKVLDGVEVEDTVNVLSRHGKVMACFSLNQHQAPNEGMITVTCRHGTARFELHRCRWQWMVEPGGEWQDESLEPLERDALFSIQAESFLDAVEGRNAPLCTLEEGIQTLRVTHAILNSATKGDWEQVYKVAPNDMLGALPQERLNSVHSTES